MNTFKVTFKNGDSLITGFNGNLKEAQEYYIEKWFNLGAGEPDLMSKGIQVCEVL